MNRPSRKRSILPGFGLTMGYTTLYLSLIVIIPLGFMFLKTTQMSWAGLSNALSDPDLISSLKLTFGMALLAAIINVIFGFITAWTLVRYRFPGHRIVDGLIDLPFALPTAVSGITLATLYVQDGWLGRPWSLFAGWINGLFGNEVLPPQVAYSRLGILVALIFIGVPFMVRTLEPALEDLDPEVEEAAASLGATRTQSFWRVVIPSLVPAMLTGFSLAFARGIGEYGSVIFISSNIPRETQITAHLIMKKLEGNDEAGAIVLGVVMVVISFAMLASINALQWWSSRRSKAEAA